jgi:hypothetical protein
VTDHQVALLEAWATVGAAVLAAVASFFAYRAYVKESRIEKRLRDSDERAQASLVAAWIGSDPIGRDPGRFVVIRNASEAPIYDVHPWILVGADQVPMDTISVIPPISGGHLVDVPPGVKRIARHSGGVSLDSFAVGLAFKDASGVSWLREDDGRLKPL